MSGIITSLGSILPTASGGSPTNMGLSTLAGNADTWSADAVWLYRVQATVSGTLQNAYVYANGTNVSVKKALVFNAASSGSPTSADTYIVSSGIITASGSAGWNTAAFASGNITSGNYYLIGCVMSIASATQQVLTENATPLYYLASSGYFLTPPADAGNVTSSSNFGRISMYVTIL